MWRELLFTAAGTEDTEREFQIIAGACSPQLAAKACRMRRPISAAACCGAVDFQIRNLKSEIGFSLRNLCAFSAVSLSV
jgi:hypothetical protein